MIKEQDYKKLYVKTQKQMDYFVKHKRFHNHQCKYCREDYNEIVSLTNKIRNMKIRKNLAGLWRTLWINGCNDFDIILYETDWDLLREECLPIHRKRRI